MRLSSISESAKDRKRARRGGVKPKQEGVCWWCRSVTLPLGFKPKQRCDVCWKEMMDFDKSYIRREEGIGGRTIKSRAERKCPQCGGLDTVSIWQKIHCQDCDYRGLPNYKVL
jgi:DNA-directed RNA polymerase subunit RPC12/RpoP